MAWYDFVYKVGDGKLKRRILKWTLFIFASGLFFNAFEKFSLPFDRVVFGFSIITVGRIIAVMFFTFFLWLHNQNKGL